MPNCRKHSTKRVCAGSFRSTNATLAAAFLLVGIGATATAEGLSIDVLAQLAMKPHSDAASGPLAKAKKDTIGVQKSGYQG